MRPRGSKRGLRREWISSTDKTVSLGHRPRRTRYDGASILTDTASVDTKSSRQSGQSIRREFATATRYAVIASFTMAWCQAKRRQKALLSAIRGDTMQFAHLIGATRSDADLQAIVRREGKGIEDVPPMQRSFPSVITCLYLESGPHGLFDGRHLWFFPVPNAGFVGVGEPRAATQAWSMPRGKDPAVAQDR